jgi:hypothetical protein
MFRHPHLIIHCEDIYQKTWQFAEETNQATDLQCQLEHLCTNWNGKAFTHLYADFCPHSFYFVQANGPNAETARQIMNGGIIYHGQVPSSGAAQFSINLTPATGWRIHT